MSPELWWPTRVAGGRPSSHSSFYRGRWRSWNFVSPPWKQEARARVGRWAEGGGIRKEKDIWANWGGPREAAQRQERRRRTMGLRRPSAREFAVQRIGQVVTLKPAVLDVVAQPLAKRGRTLQLARRLRSHRRLKHTTQILLLSICLDKLFNARP